MSRLFYNLAQSLKQIWRNKAMSLASIFAITAMMLILGLFFVISVNINLFSETLRSNYDQVEVFLKDEASTSQIKEIESKLRAIDGVTQVTYVSKSQALEIMKKRWGENGYLLDSLEGNPLPNSLVVKVKDSSSADFVSKEATTINGVEDVTYYKETVQKLNRATNFMKWSAIVVMVFLVIVSIVVVANTIKLTVFARVKEIFIMRYVGASNWFIRGPFLIEGILIGIISSMIAAAITYGLYAKLVEAIGFKFLSILSSPLVPAGYLAGNLFIIFLAVGVSIGACGSVISMRRFLNA